MVTQSSFYTYRNIRVPSDELRLEVLRCGTIGDHDQAAVREIELFLTRGHEHFNARRYHAALKDYLEARLKIYALLDVDAPSGGGGFTPPVNPGIFDGLLTEVVGRIKRFEPVPVPPKPGPVDGIAAPPNSPISAFSHLGVTALKPQGREDPAARINAAVDLARAGEYQRAETRLNEVIDAVGENRSLQAAAVENLGIVLAKQGETARAAQRFTEAAGLYQGLAQPADAARVHENHGNMLAGSGDIGGAIDALDRARAEYESAARITRSGPGARAAVPSRNGEHLAAAVEVQNRGSQLRHIQGRTGVISRVAGRIRRAIDPPPPPAMDLKFRELNVGGASAVATAGVERSVLAERRLRFVASEVSDAPQPVRVLEYPLSSTTIPEQIRTDYYIKRRTALTLEELGVGFDVVTLPGRFEVDLPHHYYFTIQVALAKTYVALGRFEEALTALASARTYPHLNDAIEAPFLWIETARVYLTWGNQLYRLNDRDSARKKYAKILVMGEAVEIDGNSELYQPAVFAAQRAQVEALIPVLDQAETGLELNPQLEAIVREAFQRQLMIRAGLNFYGVPTSTIPVFRFRYLEAVARYFADQAIKAERETINFASNAERETQAVMQLEQAVEVAEEMVELEARRTAEALATVEVSRLALEVANVRIANITARREQYRILGRDLIALDTASAHASGGLTETEGGYDVYLNSAGGTVDLGDTDYVILRNAARRRGEINYELELSNLDRAIAELEVSRAQAVAQLELANARVAVSEQGERIAEVRLRHAAENLEFARNKTFTAELWSNLASTLREISDVYMQRALEVAHLMQAAYNFEFDQNLHVISNNYVSRDELAGLLAADMLKADIDYFTYHRITQVAVKEIPAKVLWSVAERYPFLLFEFRRTGVLQFETQLADFDELYPGTYLRKLKAVEVVFEGLIGADGIHGTFTNNGVSKYRTREGTEVVRIQPRETMLISAHDLQRDAVIFRPSEEVRGVFEDAGLASMWTLDVPRGTNDLNYEAIRDIRIVFYFESFYDENLAALITASLPAEGTWQRSYSLATEFPDAFFRFQDTGELNFDSRSGDFPLHHAELEIGSLTVLALPDAGREATVRARLKRAADPEPEEFETDSETGIFASDPAAADNPLNPFIGGSPVGDWVFSMAFESNPDFVEDGVDGRQPRLVGINDIVINVQYIYQRRTAATLPA
jgi:tetratricopeptide (TPR) repeat protein